MEGVHINHSLCTVVLYWSVRSRMSENLFDKREMRYNRWWSKFRLYYINQKWSIVIIDPLGTVFVSTKANARKAERASFTIAVWCRCKTAAWQANIKTWHTACSWCFWSVWRNGKDLWYNQASVLEYYAGTRKMWQKQQMGQKCKTGKCIFPLYVSFIDDAVLCFFHTETPFFTLQEVRQIAGVFAKYSVTFALVG